MTFLSWDSQYSVGIFLFDSQHMELIKMINQLHNAMSSGQGNEVVGQIITKLAQYAEEHFQAEEQYFDNYNYPGALTHKKEHSQFIDQIQTFQKDFESGRLLLTLKVMNFLKEWLINHIQGSDKKYGPYLKSKGVR